MRIGRLRHVVTLQKKMENPDGSGGYVQTWADLDLVRALVRQESATEQRAPGEVQNVVNHRVLIRNCVWLGVNDRVLWGSRHLEIHGITWPKPDQSMMELVCREVVQP